MNACRILRSLAIIATAIAGTVFGEQWAIGQNVSDIKPSPHQVAWQDLEFGVLIHFGTNTFLDKEVGDGDADPKVFNPSDFDAEQWMRAIKSAGAKYVV